MGLINTQLLQPSNVIVIAIMSLIAVALSRRLFHSVQSPAVPTEDVFA